MRRDYAVVDAGNKAVVDGDQVAHDDSPRMGGETATIEANPDHLL